MPVRARKGKPCAIPLCPFIRQKGAYVCAAHAKATSARGHKYGAVKTEAHGRTFDSKAEARRYHELLMLQKAGEITDLRLQTPWPFTMGGDTVAHYVSDFDYKRDGVLIVEDVKSKPTMTRLYRLKRKMLRAQYGIIITETT